MKIESFLMWWLSVDNGLLYVSQHSNSFPLRPSTVSPRRNFAPKQMLFVIGLCGHLFLLSHWFQIGMVLLSHDSNVNLRKYE